MKPPQSDDPYRLMATDVIAGAMSILSRCIAGVTPRHTNISSMKVVEKFKNWAYASVTSQLGVTISPTSGPLSGS